MPIKALDHVNIVAADLDETMAFYARVLGLRPQARPDALASAIPGGWLFDDEGRALIHLITHDVARHGESRAPTGSIDHVAFACQDFAGTLAHIEGLGIPHRVNRRKYGDFSQIFLTDPNNVKLELNFPGE
ncbi:MAG TPA: VOC family protein [Novosphingobium sp.]